MKEFDVVVIGSGPAGNTAGIYLVRAGMTVAMITGSEIGGQLTTTTDVENYPAFPKGIKGFDLMNLMLEQSKNLGVEIIYDYVKQVDFSSRPFKLTTENGDIFMAKNVVISTGAVAKYLGIPSEKKFIGAGVSACATCDGNFYKNKKVAVLGGGNVAGIEALHLSGIAKEVYIIYRKDSFFRIETQVLDKINSRENIKTMFNSEVVEILGENKVEKIKIKNNITNSVEEIEMDGVFVAIGRTPKTDIFKDSGLDIDEKGYIITQPDSCRTNIKYVYACGDVSNKKVKQAIFAAGQGCLSAMEIQEDN